MKTIKKILCFEKFSQVLLTKEAMLDLVGKLSNPGDLVEIEVGDVIFEGIDDARSHA